MRDRELIEIWVQHQSLKRELIRQNQLITKTLDWVINQIDGKYLEMDEAIQHHNYTKVAECEKQILDLVAKSNREERNIDICIERQKKALEDEKKAMLSYSREKK